jgi:ferritin-like metal-binding protein YciE
VDKNSQKVGRSTWLRFAGRTTNNLYFNSLNILKYTKANTISVGMSFLMPGYHYHYIPMEKDSGNAPKFKTKTTSGSEPALMELFVDSLRDIYWAENHLIKTLPRMAAAASSQKLVSTIEDHLEQTQGHLNRLKEIFSLLGVDAIAKKCDAMEGLTKEGEGIIENTDEGTATRDVGIILASQKVEHYEIATYGGLVQLATTLSLDDVAAILALTLQEEKKADELLTELAENEVNYNASEEA